MRKLFKRLLILLGIRKPSQPPVTTNGGGPAGTPPPPGDND